MAQRQFIVRDERTLCMDGYPIQIIRHNPTSYEVLVEGRSAWRGITLDTAKFFACRHADDLDIFQPKEPME